MHTHSGVPQLGCAAPLAAHQHLSRCMVALCLKTPVQVCYLRACWCHQCAAGTHHRLFLLQRGTDGDQLPHFRGPVHRCWGADGTGLGKQGRATEAELEARQRPLPWETQVYGTESSKGRRPHIFKRPVGCTHPVRNRRTRVHGLALLPTTDVGIKYAGEPPKLSAFERASATLVFFCFALSLLATVFAVKAIDEVGSGTGECTYCPEAAAGRNTTDVRQIRRKPESYCVQNFDLGRRHLDHSRERSISTPQ